MLQNRARLIMLWLIKAYRAGAMSRECTHNWTQFHHAIDCFEGVATGIVQVQLPRLTIVFSQPRFFDWQNER